MQPYFFPQAYAVRRNYKYKIYSAKPEFQNTLHTPRIEATVLNSIRESKIACAGILKGTSSRDSCGSVWKRRPWPNACYQRRQAVDNSWCFACHARREATDHHYHSSRNPSLESSLLAQKRERERKFLLQQRKRKKKKKNLNLRRGRNTIGSSPNARFLERRPHGSTDGLIKNLQLWKGSQERITMSLLFKHVFSSSICQCNWNPSSLSAEYFIDIHRKILTANIKFTL